MPVAVCHLWLRATSSFCATLCVSGHRTQCKPMQIYICLTYLRTRHTIQCFIDSKISWICRRGAMDPCAFVRIVIGNLALKFREASKPAFSDDYSCKIKLGDFPPQFSTIPLISFQDEAQQIEDKIQGCFNFSKSELDKLIDRSSTSRKPCCLKIEIYDGRGGYSCGLSGGKLLGRLSVPLDFRGVENRGCVLQKGWMKVARSGGRMGKGAAAVAELHLDVRAEPDPRFVFEFDGEPECSPQVFQVNGNIRQPVFSCKFSFRNARDRGSSVLELSTSGSWLSSFKIDKEQPVRERKGWTITIHDLSGSAVAAASMVTPFVPSPGTDHVSRTNPGAWLILRPGYGSWKPWGRLEAWRERHDLLGYRFDIIPDGSIDPITLANSTISTKNGGKFTIDITTGVSSMSSPSSSFDFGSWFGSGSEQGSGSWAYLFYRGFVMSSTLQSDGKCSKPKVEIGAQHVTCTEDAAAYVALAAAMDLSMDACRLFSQKLRKELILTQPGQE